MTIDHDRNDTIKNCESQVLFIIVVVERLASSSRLARLSTKKKIQEIQN